MVGGLESRCVGRVCGADVAVRRTAPSHHKIKCAVFHDFAAKDQRYIIVQADIVIAKGI